MSFPGRPSSGGSVPAIEYPKRTPAIGVFLVPAAPNPLE
jgi:hypothetical protein